MRCTSRVLAGLLLAVFAVPVSAQPAAAHDGEIVSIGIHPLPAFDASPEIARYATASEYREAADDKTFTLERIEYASDGLVVSAYLYRPAQPRGRLPVVVFNRGGYVVRDQAPVLLTLFRRLAARGFLVLAPMLRGSDGTAGKDEMGGSDLDDLMNAFALLRRLEQADTGNVFLYGESRGGVMTLMALRDGAPVRAAATFGAITDIAQYLAATPQVAEVAPQIWADFEEKRDEVLANRSALSWPEKVRVPILLMHGAADEQVSPAQTLRLAERLATQRTDYGVIVYPGDGHILAGNRVDRDRRVADWFLSYVK